jgi:uncharacterized protein YjiS (DUF1127 family)
MNKSFSAAIKGVAVWPRCLATWRYDFRAWRETKRGRQWLMRLSARELGDIGLVEADVWAEVRRPALRRRAVEGASSAAGDRGRPLRPSRKTNVDP